jgi:SH3-like domain-containing protein
MPRRSTTPAPRLLLAGLLTVLSGAGLASHATGADDRFVRVKVATANLRDGPGLEAEVVRQAYQSEPLRVVARRGRWLRVRDADARATWIYEPLTDRHPAVVVVRDLVNVRARPGTGHAIVFTAERSVNLLVLGREGQWLHVEHEVGRGWVHEALVWGDS